MGCFALTSFFLAAVGVTVSIISFSITIFASSFLFVFSVFVTGINIGISGAIIVIGFIMVTCILTVFVFIQNSSGAKKIVTVIFLLNVDNGSTIFAVKAPSLFVFVVMILEPILMVIAAFFTGPSSVLTVPCILNFMPVMIILGVFTVI